MRMDVWIEACDRLVGHLARAEDETLTHPAVFVSTQLCTVSAPQSSWCHMTNHDRYFSGKTKSGG
jgi:hypothetical protein